MTTNDESRYSLSELTDKAGVSVRTVRYYVAEGLLPPPVTAGPRSSYTRAHLDRLRLIDRMKTSYLPLKEIRRRLTALDDEEVRRLLEAEIPSPPPSAAAPRAIEETAARPPDSASSYIARLLQRPASPARSAPSFRAERRRQNIDVDTIRAPSEGSPESFEELTLFEPVPEETEATSWRRIPLSDDAELLITEKAYQRKRDQIDWLVGWARKVFG